MLEKLKNRVKKSEYLMIILARFTKKNKIIKNYYKTQYEKNVLISYINQPFYNKKNLNSHSNQKEALVISKIFKELNYNVDIINFQCNKRINLEKYDIIFGFGDVFEKSFYNNKFKGKRILYATGAEPIFQTFAEIERVKEFNRRHETKLLPKRLPPSFWPLSYSLSDAIILIGNEWTKGTWKKIYDGIILTQVGSNIFYNDVKIKNKEFVFIGSFGAIHKGLDLCIEVFKELSSEYILNIFCSYEKDFFEVYGELPCNIIFHGYMDIESVEFKKILERCSFILAPTCSEGQMTSLILGIGNGLLPLATKESGVDLPEELILKENSIFYLKNKIREVYSMKSDIYEEIIKKLQKKIKKQNSLDAFQKNFDKNLKYILEKFSENYNR